MLLKLRNILFDENEAAKVLSSSKFRQTNFHPMRLFRNGVSLIEEPFFRGLILEFYQFSIGKHQDAS